MFKSIKLSLLATLVAFFVIPNLASAQQAGDVAPQAVSQCVSLQNNMTLKSKDSFTNGEVSDLQSFLQDQGLLSGDPTGYFGALTYKAVKKFQTQQGLLSSGYVGTLTRKAISSVSCNGDVVTNIDINGPAVKFYASKTDVKVDESNKAFWDSPEADSCEMSVVDTLGTVNQNSSVPVSNITGSNITIKSGDVGLGKNPTLTLTCRNKNGVTKKFITLNVIDFNSYTSSTTSSLANPTLSSVSPVSQFVVGGSSMGIVTFRLATAQAGTSATVRELNFTTTGQDAIESISVGGGTKGVMYPGVTTISGLNIPISSNDTDVPVLVKFAGFQNTATGRSLQQGVPNVGVTLTSVIASDNSGKNITNTSSVSSNKMTLVASKPTVTVSSGNNPSTLYLGVENKIGEFTVTADANGKVSLSKVGLAFSASGVNPTLSAVRIANGNTTIPASADKSTNINIQLTSPYEIAAGNSVTFSVYAVVNGTQSSPVGIPSISTRLDSNSFLWNDVIGGNNQYSGSIIYNFPTNSYKIGGDGSSVKCNSEQYLDGGVCKNITQKCPDGRVIAGMLSCNTTTSVPVVEFVGAPTLKLQYDGSGKESMLVGKATVKITAGDNPMYIMQGYVGASLRFMNLLNNEDAFSNNLKFTETVSSMSNPVPTNENREYFIPAHSSLIFNISNTAPAKEFFAGTYALRPIDLTYSVNYSNYTNFSGANPNVGAISSSSFINILKSNSVTIVGETSPYISAVSPNQKAISAGSYVIIGSRFTRTNYVTLNGITTKLSSYPVYTSNGVGRVDSNILFNLSDFRITQSGAYVMQISNEKGLSNNYSFNIDTSSNQNPTTVTQPTITNVARSSSGDLIVSGTGFNSNNTVYLDGYSSSASSWYVIGNGVTSSNNGTSLTVNVPTTYPCPTYRNGDVGCPIPSAITSGSYTLTVSNANGISNTITFMIPELRVLYPTDGLSFTTGQPIQISWQSVSPQSNYRVTFNSTSKRSSGDVDTFTAGQAHCDSASKCYINWVPTTEDQRINFAVYDTTSGLVGQSGYVSILNPASFAPTLDVYVNGSKITNGQNISLSNGNPTIQWNSNGSSCTFDAQSLATSGSQTFSGVTTSSHSFVCTNSGVSTTLSFSVTVPAAVVTPTYNSLNISQSQNGTVIATDANEIFCGPTRSTCSHSYTSGSSVVLTASPATGYTFTNWSGDCSGSSTNCTVTMSQARSVVANFSATTQTTAAPTLSSFNVVTSTSGTVRKDEIFSMNWSGSNATRFEYNVNYGTTYTPISGNSWSGSLASDSTVTPNSTYTLGLRACNASNVCSATQYKPLAVTASVVTPTYNSLNISQSQNGTVIATDANEIFCGPTRSTCSHSYTSGSSVVLTASPATGYTFTNWSGDCSGSSTNCTVTMSQARSVVANFTAPAVAPVVTAPTIDVYVNGSKITNGQNISLSNGNPTIQWNSNGSSCTFDAQSLATSGSQTFSGVKTSSHSFVCTNSGVSTTLSFSVTVPVVPVVAPATISPSISYTTGASSPRLNWDSLNASSCSYRVNGGGWMNMIDANGSPSTNGSISLVGIGLSIGTTYTFDTYCKNSNGDSGPISTITYTPTVSMNLLNRSNDPFVLGASTALVCANLPYNMHRGYEDNNVKNLQSFLVSKGLLGDTPTGFYGDKTVEAVNAYQLSKGLPQTGMVYDFTRAAIKTDSCK